MTKEWEKLYLSAKNVLSNRDISKYISCGSVAAALETINGNIYVGICVDTPCSLGICAERNAIFSMLTNGESKIKRILAISESGFCSPCGACRELMVQLMPDDYQNIEVMIDEKRIVKLRDLTPMWWIKNQEKKELKTEFPILEDFYNYLRHATYDKKQTKFYTHNTSKEYSDYVDKIRIREHLIWNDFVKSIDDIIIKYDKKGPEEEYGNRGNRTGINALKAFAKFIESKE